VIITWKETGDVLIVATAVVSGLFVVLYAILAPWQRTPEGRNIMAVMGTLFVSLAYFAWAVARGGVPPFFYPIRASLFALMATFIGQRVIILIKAQVIRRRAIREARYVEEVRQVDRDAVGNVADGGHRNVP
jgi:high-affinity Fe2+/Pb2+ permease